MKIKNIYILLLGMATLSSCYDLNKEPEGTLSTTNPFTTVGEINGYLDQFYNTGIREQAFGSGSEGIAYDDINSDNMSTGSVSARLNGDLTLANASALSEYTQIRNVNFFLNHLGNSKEKGTDYEQAVGEGYYFRAWFYYQLFKKYGEITWLSKPLDPNFEEMKLPRQNRTLVADSILADLDKAILFLKTQDNSASRRVHKDCARALKAQVALFEGTWEKYHKAKDDAFYDKSVTDDKIKEYLRISAEASKAVIDRGVWKIYNTGNPLNDYRVIFQTQNLDNNPEILWYKEYDGVNVGNNVDRYLNTGGGSVGANASLVDDYLTRDGKPFVGEEKLNAKKVYGDELQPTLRDPRLSQTIAKPGQVLRPDQSAFTVPPLTGAGYTRNETGYAILKHVQIDYTGSLDAEYKGATPGIQYRYADVLLDYAEALAELDGAGNAQKIIEALDPLRKRAGMPSVDFDREYNTDSSYPFAHLDKYIQAVRRERRVEQALEGTRFTDICRWAAADELIVGKRPTGALFVGSNLEKNAAFEGRLVYDQPSDNNLYLTGNPGDAYRYVTPMSLKEYPAGWKFDVKRDYLLPIQSRMLSLTDHLWTQNPGW